MNKTTTTNYLFGPVDLVQVERIEAEETDHFISVTFTDTSGFLVGQKETVNVRLSRDTAEALRDLLGPLTNEDRWY